MIYYFTIFPIQLNMGANSSFIVSSTTLPTGEEYTTVFDILRDNGCTLTATTVNGNDIMTFELPPGWVVLLETNTDSTQQTNYFLDTEMRPRFSFTEQKYKFFSVDKIKTSFVIYDNDYDVPFQCPLPHYYIRTEANYILMDSQSPECGLLNRLKDIWVSYTNYLQNYYLLREQQFEQSQLDLRTYRNEIKDNSVLSTSLNNKEFAPYIVLLTGFPITENEILTYCKKLVKTINNNYNEKYCLWVFDVIHIFNKIIKITMNRDNIRHMVSNRNLCCDPNAWVRSYTEDERWWRNVAEYMDYVSTHMVINKCPIEYEHIGPVGKLEYVYRPKFG